ncbi:MAG: hypothetical protein AB2374_19530 [Cytobacillus gottheilii]|uniref:hypothetical protein n=1 Tax=Cytobacillus gottheilii TaxID=859144 RepID=UPI003464164B
MIARSIKDQPNVILAVNYHDFASRGDDYYYAPSPSPKKSAEKAYGINLLQSKLSELEAQGKTDTFEYKKLLNALDTLVSIGEPQFTNILLWENSFANWAEHLMQFLLFIPLTFVIAPIFSIEQQTGMDNLILSARNGRRKVVTAKLLSTLVASVTLVGIYVLATFAFSFIPHATIHGWDAAIQSIPTYARSMFDYKVCHYRRRVAALYRCCLYLKFEIYDLIS